MSNEADTKIAPIPAAKIAGNDLTVAAGTVLPETMKEVEALAQYMAKAGSAIPWSMQGSPGECMAVIMDAISWRMNPWAVARMRYVTKSKDGNLTGGYMGQLFQAVMNTRAGLKKRLVPTYDGAGPAMVCRIRAETQDGEVLEYESPRVADIEPKNSPLWKSDPRQQLAYYSIRGFARRYFADLMMGIYDPDEVHEIARMRDITPKDPVENMLEDEPETVTGEVIDPEPKLEMMPRDPGAPTEREIERQQAALAEVLGPEELAKMDAENESIAADTADYLKAELAIDRIYFKIVSGLKDCKTTADYSVWREANYNAKTRKQLGEDRWTALAEVMIATEDRIGWL